MDPWHVPPPRDKAFLVEFGVEILMLALCWTFFSFCHWISVIFDVNVNNQQTISTIGASGRVALGATL